MPTQRKRTGKAYKIEEASERWLNTILSGPGEFAILRKRGLILSVNAL